MRRITIGGIGLGLFAGLFLFWAAGAASEPKPADHETSLITSIQGPALYTAYCAVCHGADGKGNGPMASSLKVRPPDLTHMAANHGRFSLKQTQQIILGEQQLPAGHGTKEMPVWGPIFSQVERDRDMGRVRVYNLAKYLEALQAK